MLPLQRLHSNPFLSSLPPLVHNIVCFAHIAIREDILRLPTVGLCMKGLSHHRVLVVNLFKRTTKYRRFEVQTWNGALCVQQSSNYVTARCFT